MLLINAPDYQHGHENVEFINMTRIAGKKRLDGERFVGLDNEIDPRARNVYPRQLVCDFVNLENDEALAKCCGFNNRGGIFRVGPSINVALGITFLGTNQGNIWNQIDKHAGIKLDVCMDRSDIKLLVLKELSDSQALRAGVGKINLVRDAVLEKVQMLRPANAGNQHVNFMNLPGIDLCQGARKKIGLFLIIPFQSNAITRLDEGFQCLNNLFLRNNTTLCERTRLRYKCVLFLSSLRPRP